MSVVSRARARTSEPTDLVRTSTSSCIPRSASNWVSFTLPESMTMVMSLRGERREASQSRQTRLNDQAGKELTQW